MNLFGGYLSPREAAHAGSVESPSLEEFFRAIEESEGPEAAKEARLEFLAYAAKDPPFEE